MQVNLEVLVAGRRKTGGGARAQWGGPVETKPGSRGWGCSQMTASDGASARMWGRGWPEGVRDRTTPLQSPLARRTRVPGAALTILGPARPFVPAAPAAPAEAAATPWTAASSRSPRRHYPPPSSRESTGGTCAGRSVKGRGL